MKRGLVVLAVMAGFAGCGGDDKDKGSAKGDSFNSGGDATYTEAQVAELAGFTADEGGLSYTGPADCEISVIMTTRGAVETYAGAGDAVVTNPSGKVGVKFFPEPGCREKLLAALRKVK